jgi:hypothetical protein
MYIHLKLRVIRRVLEAGVARHGIFAIQKSLFGNILEGFGMENVDIFKVKWYFYCYFMANGYLVNFCIHSVVFHSLVCCTHKHLAPLLRAAH